MKFWTPTTTENGLTVYFHMIANGYALFTSKTSEAFKCTDKEDCKTLASLLHDNDERKWTPVKVTLD